MTQISQADLENQLQRERDRRGTRNYEWDESNNFVPTPANVPAPSQPGRRPASQIPTGASPFGIITAVRDDACNIRRVLSPSAFASAFVPLGSTLAQNPNWLNAFDRNWDNLCGDSPGAHPGVESPIVPFQGGQCDGARYNIQVQVERYQIAPACNSSIFTSGNAGVFGPITGVDIGSVNGSAPLIRVFCRGAIANGLQAPGTIVTLGSVGSAIGCPPSRIVSVNVQPQSGQPNNCGNPPARYRPTEPRALPVRPITIDLGGQNVQIQPEIGFNIETGDITFDIGPDLNVSFDGANFNFPGGQGGGDDGGGDSRPSPDDTATDPAEPPPEPPPEPSLEEPDEQPEQVIRAALVSVTNVSGFQTIINGVEVDPDNYFPDLGTIKFRCRVNGESSGFTNPIRVQNRRAFIECPWDGGAFQVVGTPRPGVSWTITPVYDTTGIPSS